MVHQGAVSIAEGPVRAEPRLPHFLIVGAQKAGTSALFAALAEHPAVFGPPGKELHFFDRDEAWEGGLDWYAGHFAGAPAGACLGEATPEYMFGCAPIERMAATVPDARLVVLLRNPTERAFSGYWQLRTRSFVSLPPFDEHIRTELKRSPMRAAEELDPASILDRGLYLAQLTRLCESFSREQVLILLQEDFRATPAAAFARVCEHIGVDPSVRPDALGRTFNRTIELKQQWFWRGVLKYQLGKKPVVGPVLRRRLRTLQRAEKPRSSPPQMSPETRTLIDEWYRAPNAALGEWLGLPGSPWAARAVAAVAA